MELARAQSGNRSWPVRRRAAEGRTDRVISVRCAASLPPFAADVACSMPARAAWHIVYPRRAEEGDMGYDDPNSWAPSRIDELVIEDSR